MQTEIKSTPVRDIHATNSSIAQQAAMGNVPDHAAPEEIAKHRGLAWLYEFPGGYAMHDYAGNLRSVANSQGHVIRIGPGWDL